MFEQLAKVCSSKPAAWLASIVLLGFVGTPSAAQVVFNSGTYAGPSSINATFTINTSEGAYNNPLILDVSTLTTGGTTTISGQGYFYGGAYPNSPTWNNSGTINFSDDTSLRSLNQYYGSSAYVDYTLNNTGALEKTGGAGTSTLDAVVINSGIISTQSGTLLLADGVNLNNGSTLNGGGVTAVNGNVVVSGTTTIGTGATLQLTGGNSLSGAGTITGAGTVLWKTSSLSGNATINSAFAIDTSDSPYNSPLILNVSSLTTGGTTTISGQGYFYGGAYPNNPVWSNSGTINFSDDTSLRSLNQYYGSGYVDYTLNNTGTLKKTGGSGTSTLAAAVNNGATGIISAQTGTLAISDASTNSGHINVSSGSAVQFNGGLTLNDGSSLAGAGTVSMTGSDVINGATTLGSGTTLQFTGYNSISGTGTISGGTVLWKDGTLGGTGGSTINSAFTIDTSAGAYNSPLILDVSSLTTEGTTTISGQGYLYGGAYPNSPTWINSGTINFSDDTSLRSLNQYYSTSAYADYTLNNAGTLEKTGGTGTSTLAAAVHNSATGTISAESGTLAVSDASTNAGHINVSSAAAIQFNGGLTNSGLVDIAKTGNLGVSGTFQQTATGSLVGEGTLTGNANISGAIEAGNSGLTILGNLTLNSDGTLNFDLGSVNVLGNLSLSNSDLHLNLSYGSDLLSAGTVLTLTSYSGTRSGFFDYNGITHQNGSTFNDGVNSFEINYANNGAITLTALGAAVNDPTYTPVNAVPLGVAGPNAPAYVQGSQQLGSPVTTVDSVYVQDKAVLTLYAGDVLNAPDGLNILQGGTVQGSGTINGNVINSGTLDILLSAKGPKATVTKVAGTIANTGTIAIGGSSDGGGGGGGGGGTDGGGADGGNGFVLGAIYNEAPVAPSDPTPSIAILSAGTVGPVETEAVFEVRAFNGKLAVNGSYTQTETGLLKLHIRGYSRDDGDYSFLSVTGAAVLDGSVLVVLDDGFTPVSGSSFDVMEADGGITLASTLNFQLPDGFSYRLIDNNTVLELVSNSLTVPEPSTWALILLGAIGLCGFNRNRKRT